MLAEFIPFIGDTLKNTLQASPLNVPQTGQIFTAYEWGMLVLLVGGFILGIISMSIAPPEFIGGYILEDVGMLVIFYSALARVAPPVLTGMFLAFIPVAVGIVIQFLILPKVSNTN